MCALWLVEDCIISCYNHPARGDYNTEALIFRVAAVRFLDVSDEKMNKMKENTKKKIPLFASSSVNNPLDFVLGIIPQYSLRLWWIIIKYLFIALLPRCGRWHSGGRSPACHGSGRYKLPLGSGWSSTEEAGETNLYTTTWKYATATFFIIPLKRNVWFAHLDSQSILKTSISEKELHVSNGFSPVFLFVCLFVCCCFFFSLF